MIEELKYLISILISVILGFLIGYERKLRFKEAGIRTHTIVCAGSALIMVVSKEIADLSAKNLVMTRLHASGALNDADYAQKFAEINNKLPPMHLDGERPKENRLAVH